MIINSVLAGKKSKYASGTFTRASEAINSTLSNLPVVISGLPFRPDYIMICVNDISGQSFQSVACVMAIEYDRISNEACIILPYYAPENTLSPSSVDNRVSINTNSDGFTLTGTGHMYAASYKYVAWQAE